MHECIQFSKKINVDNIEDLRNSAKIIFVGHCLATKVFLGKSPAIHDGCG